MNKESPEALDYIFKMALDVYFEKKEKNNAIVKIHEKFNTNESSCGMYIRIIINMLKGERYTRGMSSTATDNILKNFFFYDNKKFFNNSIHSLEQFINHYEKSNGITLHRLRVVLSKWTVKKRD